MIALTPDELLALAKVLNRVSKTTFAAVLDAERELKALESAMRAIDTAAEDLVHASRAARLKSQDSTTGAHNG